MGIDRGIADQAVDAPVGRHGGIDEVLELFDVADVAGHGDGIAALGPDALDDLLAGVELAAGNDDLGAGLRHALADSPADALGTAGDDGDPSVEVEETHVLVPLPCKLMMRPALRGCRGPY